MALQCKINYDQNGQIDYIETDNGQRSKLFDDLVKLFGGDKNLALDYYALTEDKEFQAVYGKDDIRFSIAGERGITNLGISTISSPQKINQELIDRLKQNGLSEDVFLMSTEEIDVKLKELGVSDEVRKQVIAYHGSPHSFDRLLTKGLIQEVEC